MVLGNKHIEMIKINKTIYAYEEDISKAFENGYQV